MGLSIKVVLHRNVETTLAHNAIVHFFCFGLGHHEKAVLLALSLAPLAAGALLFPLMHHVLRGPRCPHLQCRAAGPALYIMTSECDSQTNH